MFTLSPEALRLRVPVMAVALLIGAGVCLTGCGPTEETFEDEEWETNTTPPPSETPQASPAPAVTPAAPHPIAVDSLLRVNLALQAQVDALTAENKTMRGRIAELESGLRNAQAAAPAATAPAYANPSSDLKAAYAEALDQFMNRNYQASIQQFEALLQAHPGSDLADNCTYWIGESYYALKNYSEAIRHFGRVLEYPTSGKKPYAQFMIGNSQMALGNRDSARDAFNAVVATYPTSPLIAKAQAKLSRLY